MKNQNIILTCFFLFMFSCSNGKKTTLETEVNENVTKEQTHISDFSSIDTFKGERKKEIRRVDPKNSPMVLDISGELEKKELDVTSIYPKISFTLLKHPKSTEGKNFIIKTPTMPIPSAGKNFTRPTFFTRLAKNVPFPTFLSVKSYKDWVLVGNLSGLFCYTKDGEYLYTLLESDEFSDVSQSGSVDIDMNTVNNVLCGFSVMDNICAFASATQGESTLHFFDLENGTEIYKKTMPINNVYLLNGKHKTLINYSYEVRDRESLPFMNTLTAENDTVCTFYNKNTFTDMTGMPNFHNPGSPNIYNFEDRLFVRQQGNDTIYRFNSEYEINPVYVFKTGNYQATIQDIIKGKLEDKRSIDEVVETEKLLIFSLRNSDVVLYYDKNTKKIYEASQMLSGENSGVLPLSFGGLSGNEKLVYGIYTKMDIEGFIKNKQLSIKYDTINTWKNKLKDGELLLMLME